MEPKHYPAAIIDRIAGLLEEGKSLREICALDGFPSRSTVYDWIRGNDEIAARLRDAREIGYLSLADQAVAIAMAPAEANPTDPHAARVALDALKWKLGKLSIAFGEKPLVQGTINVGDPDAFAAFARALEDARRARAGGATSTIEVDGNGEARPADTGRELARLAGPGGAGLGQDEGGC